MSSHVLSRRAFHRLMLAAGVGLVASSKCSAETTPDGRFVHPGILHTAADLQRMKTAVRARRQPIAAGFEKLRQHPLSSAAYTPQKFAAEIGRNPSVNFDEFDSDANAAYQCALMAAITEDVRYAAVARSIIVGWSASLERVSGADAVLMAGLGPFKFVNAAEILRYLGQLDRREAENCRTMLRRAILPTIVDFAPFANGNWDTAAVKTMLAIAVFCDDRALFERALLYYLHGDGDGRLAHYIYDNGQCQESGRDQQHTQLGLAHLGDACQIAWNQGWDLYAAENNRLLRGFEYTAGYNLGQKVDFRPDVDCTGHYRHSVISPPGLLRPVYEQILAHYQVLCGIPAPAVEKAVKTVRPEGAAHGADHTGFGTLLYARAPGDSDPAPSVVPPAALHAVSRGKVIELDWLRTRAAATATLERAGLRAEVDGRAESYRDANVTESRQYAYRVARADSHGLAAQPVSIVAGLPERWSSVPLGSPAVAGDVQFDGTVFTIYAAGKGLMQTADEGHFLVAAPSVSRLQARWIPQVASQFASFGVAWRADFAANAPSIALLIASASGDRGQRGWRLRFVIRDASGKTTSLSESQLSAPVVSYGRLMKPVWLSLESKGGLLAGAFSTDGGSWTQVGQFRQSGAGRIGLVAASGIPEVSTAVRFELASN